MIMGYNCVKFLYLVDKKIKLGYYLGILRKRCIMLNLIRDGMLFAVEEVGAEYFCRNLGPVITLLKNIVRLLQWGIPIILILFGLIDLGKAVMSSKEDEMKKAQGTLIKRVIYAVIVFFVVTIVYFVMGIVGSDDWKDCWDGVGGAEAENVEA